MYGPCAHSWGELVCRLPGEELVDQRAAAGVDAHDAAAEAVCHHLRAKHRLHCPAHPEHRASHLAAYDATTSRPRAT